MIGNSFSFNNYNSPCAFRGLSSGPNGAMVHNNLYGNGLLLHYIVGASGNLNSDNYWGTDWSSEPWLGTPPQKCTAVTPAISAAPYCSGGTDAVAPVNTPWPLCINDPTNTDCVGAHDLCANTPSDPDCVGVRP